MMFTKVKDQHPTRHAKHLVERDGILFTATPCYGMHEPWWVVKTMASNFSGGGEADPVPMQAEDRWLPLVDARQVIGMAETEYALASENVADPGAGRAWDEFRCADRLAKAGEAVEGVLFDIHRKIVIPSGGPNIATETVPVRVDDLFRWLNALAAVRSEVNKGRATP